MYVLVTHSTQGEGASAGPRGLLCLLAVPVRGYLLAYLLICLLAYLLTCLLAYLRTCVLAYLLAVLCRAILA